MIRRLIVAVVVSMFVMNAWGTGEKAPTLFSGVERMVFRNGSHPTAEYAGITVVGMDADSTAVTKGDMSFVGDSLVWVGATEAEGTYNRALVSIDLSALPESSLVVRAILHLWTSDSQAGPTGLPQLSCYRLFRPFDAAPTWTNRKTETATDTAWYVAGALSTLGQGPKWPAYGSAGAIVLAPRNEYRTSMTGLPTWKNFPLAMGSDSLYSGYSQITTLKDALCTPDMSEPGRFNYTSVFVWSSIDITRFVYHWHAKQWLNAGFVLDVDTDSNINGFGVQFRGSYPLTNDSGGAADLAPWVEVWYVTCGWPE